MRNPSAVESVTDCTQPDRSSGFTTVNTHERNHLSVTCVENSLKSTCSSGFTRQLLLGREISYALDCGNSFGSQSTNSLNSAVRDLLEFTRGRLVWFFKLLRMNTHYHPLTFFRERLDYSSNIHYTGKCLMRLNVTITIQLQSYCGSQIIGHPHKPEVHLLTLWDT